MIDNDGDPTPEEWAAYIAEEERLAALTPEERLAELEAAMAEVVAAEEAHRALLAEHADCEISCSFYAAPGVGRVVRCVEHGVILEDSLRLLGRGDLI